jgi:hypothetical protein
MNHDYDCHAPHDGPGRRRDRIVDRVHLRSTLRGYERPGTLNVSISERVVDFVRRISGSPSEADIEELATQIRQITTIVARFRGTEAVPEIRILIERLSSQVARAQTEHHLGSVDDLVADIRQLRQLGKLGPPPNSRPSPAETAQLLSGLDGFLSLVSLPGRQLRRCSYGSPFEITVIVGATSAGLRLLFYGAKRLLGFDLEVQTYRTKLRARLEAARIDVEVLERAKSAAEERAQLNAQLDSAKLDIGPWRAQTGTALGLDEDPPDYESGEQH